MKNNAFIFARGGSKGLPRKNIRPLNGKPLIEYSIDIALASPSIDKVFVSTEDDDIAQISLNAGAILIERPRELASDTSPELLSWRHAVDWVEKKYGSFEGFVSLPATSPLREVMDVEAAIYQRREAGADICISVTPASRSPYFNMVKKKEDGLVGLINTPSSGVFRRQDAPLVFDVTTVVYATTAEYVVRSSGVFEGKVTSVEIPKERAVDIDDIYDFKLAEIIMQEKHNARVV